MNNLDQVYNIFKRKYRVTTDSRTIEPGTIFFALKGENFDGNRFATNALKQGASLAVVDCLELKDTEGCFYTPNVLSFLHDFAKYHRNKLNIPIIGLTGSNGKTTTKELLREVLSSKFNVYATKGNLNNHIGVPLTLLSITPEIEIAIIEMGANHVGEIDFLCSLAKPTHGLITNIGKAHIGEFGGPEGVIRAKTELYQFIKNSNGTVFYNSDNELLGNEVVKHSLLKSSIDYAIKTFSARTIPGREPYLSVSLVLPEHEIIVNTQLTGHYNLENILAACTIGSFFGVDAHNIKERIEAYIPSNSRSQVVKTEKNSVVLDAYNANPSSMEVALASFASLPSEMGKVVMLGEMLELGIYSPEEHLRIASMAVRLGFENVILVGQLFPKSVMGCTWFATSTQCADYFRENGLSNKLILVKGSRGTKMEVVMEVL